MLRNYYFNRDFRDHSAGKSKVDEWAQGFILKFSSGYTPGPVGFGLKGLPCLGSSSTAVAWPAVQNWLPVNSDGRAADNFGRAGLAAKARFSQTEMKVGELLPDVPVLRLRRWATAAADLPWRHAGVQGD